METNAFFSMLKSMSGFAEEFMSADAVVAFGVFYKRGNKDNVLFLENTTRQMTSLSAKSAQYPVEYGFYQTEFKYKEPNKVRLTGVISRKGTGLLGINFSISSLALKDPIQSKSKLIKETRKDLDYLIANNVLCEIWSLNGGKREYMTLTSAEIIDDNQHTGLFEVDLQFEEVQQLILEPEPLSGDFAKTVSTGVCMVTGK